MTRIHIVTDSTVQFCTPHFADRHAFDLVPLKIQFGQPAYREDTEITTAQLWEQVAGGAPLPVTVAPTTEQFAALYADLSRSTDQILSLHVSSKLSDTVRHAEAASGTIRGRCRIEVIDSLSISAGLGALVEIAAQAAELGATLETVVRLVRSAIPRLYSLFFVESLDYLAHAGKVNPAHAILAEMLSLRPFITLEEGNLTPMEKARHRFQALEKVIEFVTEFTDIRHLAILHGGSDQLADAQLVRERLEAVYPGRTWPVLTYNPSLAALLGPDALGVMVCEEEVEPE